MRTKRAEIFYQVLPSCSNFQKNAKFDQVSKTFTFYQVSKKYQVLPNVKIFTSLLGVMGG